jgi:hypothetical protein
MTAFIAPNDWHPPRCTHGHIILGCPHADCEEQNAYIAHHEAALDAYYQTLLGHPVTVTD